MSLNKLFKTRSLFIFIAALCAAVLLCACGRASLSLGDTSESSGTCTIGIFCDEIFDHENDFKGDIKDIGDGILLDYTEISIYENDTVMSATLRVLEENGIEYSAKSNYIRSIGGISEFDCGKLSGWTYYINGSWSNVSAAACTLTDGDIIKWNYSCTNKTDNKDEK